MPTLLNLTKTCPAFPAQWEAETPDGGCVYIRLRHGVMRWGSGKDMHEAIADCERHAHVYEPGLARGDPGLTPGARAWYGEMTTEEMLVELPRLWPEWAPLEVVYIGHVVP